MFFSRKSPRLHGFDYSSCNYYFITICTYEKRCIFGTPGKWNEWGKIAGEHVKRLETFYPSVKVDKYVIMPNHVHMIIVLDNGDRKPNVSALIGLYKTGVTKEIRSMYPEAQIWQRSFHDHIIRNQNSYDKIWEYIENNPLKWDMDCFYQKEAEI